MKIKFSTVCALALTIICLSVKAQSPDYKFIKKIPLEGNGKWDYLKWMASAKGYLYRTETRYR